MILICRCLWLLVLLVSPCLHAQTGQTEGINESYKSPDLDVQQWAQRFEVEGREAYDLRHGIVERIGLKLGEAVADVGAGTGLFVPLLAKAVGPEGTVYAIDIAPRFIDHIANRAASARLHQVKTILSNERSIELPPSSVDVIFTCDAYHHFVHYRDMLASMHRALKAGGDFIVVDFDIESPALAPAMVEHVGKRKDVFRQQIEAAGFKFAEDLTLPSMRSNFMYRFVKN